MRYLAENGFNVVYPVVWNGGYTLYPSSTLESVIGVDRDPAIGQRDVLQEVIIEAHRFGMEVIPWMEYGFAASFGQDGGPLLAARPEWAARTFIGSKVEKNGFFWMSGLNPNVQQFILDLMSEILAYDVDGIQGDDRLPAMPVEGGYSDVVQQLYRGEHGGTGPPPDETDADWVQWRSDKLTAFAGTIHNHVKGIDANLKVVFSPSVWPWSRDNYLQDWPAWIANGHADIVHPQLYPPPPRSVDAYRSLVHDMVGTTPGDFLGYIPSDQREGLFPGLLIKAGSDIVGADRVLAMLDTHRSLGLHGESFFFYEGLGAQNDFLANDLHAVWYGERAPLPDRLGDWRPVTTMLTPAPGTGAWTDLGGIGPDTSGIYTALHGSGSEATWQGTAPAAAHYDLYMWIPDAIDMVSENALLTVVSDIPAMTPVGRLSPNAYVDPMSSTVEAAPEAPTITLFPNPASDYIMVPETPIDVYDILGRRILQKVKGRVDVSHLPPGVYLARSLLARGGSASRLFVVK
ncbi:MAG: T9SS C-terminal target domain-containing protein [Bacteroidetes bacterium]|nr:T9SS C-terminal target domain-containing protein [Bacteroidota bacterium]